MGIQQHLPFQKIGCCSRCGRQSHDNDGSPVTWKCAVCGGIVCRHCTLTNPHTSPLEYFDMTLCSEECRTKERVSRVGPRVCALTHDAPAIMKVVHLVLPSEDQPGSHQCTCAVCRKPIMPGIAPFWPIPEFPLWTDDVRMWHERRLPEGHVRCDDLADAERAAKEIMES